jgi:hypothetical protein
VKFLLGHLTQIGGQGLTQDFALEGTLFVIGQGGKIARGDRRQFRAWGKDRK